MDQTESDRASSMYDAVVSLLPPETPFVVLYMVGEDRVGSISNMPHESVSQFIDVVRHPPMEKAVLNVSRDN